jgi:hypothetical protein
VITPHVIDLARSPLAGHFDAETYVLGAFNPGMTVLPNGNVLLMVRVAEALREPVRDGKVHAIRWDGDGREIGGQAFGRYVLDAWPLELVDTRDPRKFMVPGGGWKVMALTSLSWLLPVEMTPDAMDIVAIHYDKAIAPQGRGNAMAWKTRGFRAWPRAIPDDHVFGQPGAAFHHALFLRQRPGLDVRGPGPRSPEQGHADLSKAW